MMTTPTWLLNYVTCKDWHQTPSFFFERHILMPLNLPENEMCSPADRSICSVTLHIRGLPENHNLLIICILCGLFRCQTISFDSADKSTTLEWNSELCGWFEACCVWAFPGISRKTALRQLNKLKVRNFNQIHISHWKGRQRVDESAILEINRQD